MAYALAYIVSENYTVFGWTTHGHNGETIPLWMHGAMAPAGTIDNTDLAKMAADFMGVNLKRQTRRLYADVSEHTNAYTIDWSDPANPVLVIGPWNIPISKDYMTKTRPNGNIGRTIPLPGVAVYAPMTDKVYVSKKALRKAKVLP
jgi:alkaline phosphatase